MLPMEPSFSNSSVFGFPAAMDLDPYLLPSPIFQPFASGTQDDGTSRWRDRATGRQRNEQLGRNQCDVINSCLRAVLREVGGQGESILGRKLHQEETFERSDRNRIRCSIPIYKSRSTRYQASHVAFWTIAREVRGGNEGAGHARLIALRFNGKRRR